MAVLVQVPIDVEFGGLKLAMHPLRDCDHVEMDRWAQAQMVDTARRSVSLDDPAFDRVVGLALRESLAVTWARSGCTRSVAGYARLVWIACRKAVPEPDVLAALGRMTRLETRALNDAFLALNFGTAEAKPDAPNPPAPG